MPRIPLNEIGQTGLAQFAGQVSETHTAKLTWPSAYGIYDEMRRRDPTIRTMWNALVMLSRTASWYFEPESESPEDRDAADFLQDCLADMSHTPEDAIEDALTCMLFGWSWLEIVYKRRDDGAIGWRKWAPRRQSSFSKWGFDATGGVQALVQRPAPDYQEIEIPIGKSLHFTFQRDGGNPEGLALLESLYETWYYLKNLQIINGIGWQRSFVGLPVFEFEETPGDDDRAEVERVGQALSVDAKQYLSVPKGIKFRLESVANSSAEALLHTIQYYRLQILQTMLADFINLGTGQTGSWALGSDKSQLFLMATDGTLDRMANVVNRHGVPRLLSYNPQIVGEAHLTHTKVEKPALGQLANWLQQVGDLLTWTVEDENWIRKRTGMPAISERSAVGGQRSAVSDQQAEDGDSEGELNPFAEFAEFADYDGRDRERRGIEGSFAQEILAFLREQMGRVADVIRRDPTAVDDDAFWQAEGETFRQTFLGRLLSAVRSLVGLAVEDTTAQVGAGADWTGVNTAAASWAREYAGELIAGITETTRTGVREAVAGWIEAGAELPDLVETLTPTFGETRAELIATTEVTRAYDEANDVVRQQLGLPAAAMKAPAHARCRCATRPVLLPNGEWVVVWYTVRDDRVCKRPLSTPWGSANGCRDLHGMVVSDNYGGQSLSDVRAAAKP
jgi:phage gp29-like protein